ncbi:alpha/beta hydrolase [Streptomyces sp. ME02-8801-2C]|uniref:RBBP9/YdeN family alpha/beta hydrolase n=1 Tax=Streptomyces sp. ME02-8801-2C TaxID=3028680 RepID=UPI0029B44D34|nr:alpha/beta hydrolase [Streptomyces sp. ME02-8801-2C]MDX3454665.1 alpha/beta hydrolase [Streptomyces sp. ME02-8801-2C]
MTLTTHTTHTTHTTPRGFLILHGWQNRRPKTHWQHWLADRLTGLGHQVVYPQLPDPDAPDLETWLAELSRHLRELRPGAERVLLAHSASAVLWLHAVARGLPGVPDIDRVLLVAPPSASVLVQHPEIARFAPPALDFALPGRTELIAGDDDPYCPEGAGTVYGDPLNIPTRTVRGGAHLDPDAGYGPWPAMLDWCLS